MIKILLVVGVVVGCPNRDKVGKPDIEQPDTQQPDIQQVECNRRLSTLALMAVEYQSLGGRVEIGEGVHCPSDVQLDELRQELNRVKAKIKEGAAPKQVFPTDTFEVHQSPVKAHR